MSTGKRKRYWLMKSEPEDFSIGDLERVGTEPWTGVRNYQARNFMRDGMRVGDGVLFYHSNCDVPGIYGVAEVASDAYPDPTQFKRKSKYFDPKATPEEPRWMLVDVGFVRRLDAPVTLAAIRERADALGEEFALTAIELSFLNERKQAFDNLAWRVDLDAVRGVVTTMIQTERYGTPLASALRVLSAEFRNERMMRAEEKAARLPAIMTVPLILFILPVLFIVILGPAACSISDTFINR